MISNAKERTSLSNLIGLSACLLVGLALRIVVILHEPNQLTIDRDAYLGIAVGVAEGRGYCSPESSSATAFRPPLYPLTLAIGCLWFSPAFVVAAVNLLTGLLTVWLVVCLGKRLQLGPSRFVAGLLVAVDPLLLRYSSRPMTESFCAMLVTGWLLSVTPTSNPGDSVAHSLKQGIAGGFSFGLLVLSRPTFWSVAALFGLKWLIDRRRNPQNVASSSNAFYKAILTTVTASIVVAPWVIRNWLVMGVPILTTTHGGYTLLLGNNPVFYEEEVKKPWGTVWPNDSQQRWSRELEALMAIELGPQATEVERDSWQARLAKKNIATEPGAAIAAVVHRIRSLWNTIPLGDTAGGVNRIVINSVGWFYAIELAMGFIGMLIVLSRKERNRWLPMYVLIASVQIVHLFYWTNTRMRAPLMPPVALFAAAILRGRAAKGT